MSASLSAADQAQGHHAASGFSTRQFRAGEYSRAHRPGFTIVELLVAMAVLIFIMAVLSESFSAGATTFRNLKAAGDMEESLRAATVALRRDLAAAHFGSREFIVEAARSGAGDPRKAEELSGRYESICDQAERLHAEYGRINPPSRVAQRVQRSILTDLSRIKVSAQLMVELLRQFEDQSKPSED